MLLQLHSSINMLLLLVLPYFYSFVLLLMDSTSTSVKTRVASDDYDVKIFLQREAGILWGADRGAETAPLFWF